MHAGLVGWVSAQEPSPSFRKSICTTDRCVVEIVSQLFSPGEKKGGENKDCFKLYFPPRAGVWIFGFYDNKHVEILEKLVDYFLRSNKSNINQ